MSPMNIRDLFRQNRLEILRSVEDAHLEFLAKWETLDDAEIDRISKFFEDNINSIIGWDIVIGHVMASWFRDKHPEILRGENPVVHFSLAGDGHIIHWTLEYPILKLISPIDDPRVSVNNGRISVDNPPLGYNEVIELAFETQFGTSWPDPDYNKESRYDQYD